MLNSQWFFLAQTHEIGTYKYCYYNFKRASEGYFEFYVILDFFMYAFIPSALLLILNTSIVIKLVKAKLKPLTDRNLSQSTLSKTALSTCVMLLAVSLAYMVLIIPSMALWVMRELEMPVSLVLQETMLVSVNLNHSLNAVLYTLVGPKFRKEVYKLVNVIFRCKKTRVGPLPSSSTKDTVSAQGHTGRTTC